MTKRRAIILGSVSAAVLAAWRYRLLQVGSFTAVAGLRRLLQNDLPPDFQALAPQWSAFKPTRTYAHVCSRGMITYHPWYDQFQPAVANRCLAETAELGAGHIRLDVRWKDLLPDGHHVNEAAWAWYQHYLVAAREWYGLEPLIVLYNAPKAVLRSPPNQRTAAWTRYVHEVAQRAGKLCNTYQLLNEPNNPVYELFPQQNAAEAIVVGARIIREHNPDARTTINILAGLLGWQSDLEGMLRATGSAIDVVGIDYYPGTWTVSANSDATNWREFIDYISRNRATNSSPFFGKLLAIMETGYSTNLRSWRGEEQQVRYLKMLERAMKRLDEQIGEANLLLVGIHELSDDNSNAWLDPEAHFGVLMSTTLERKAGFEATKQLFRALQSRTERHRQDRLVTSAYLPQA